MGNYSMPGYFQSMQVLKGSPFAPNAENVAELKGIEAELHEQVAKFFPHGVIISVFGGVHIFSHLAEETFIQAFMSLFPVPRAAFRAAKFFHDLIQLVDLFHLSFSFRLTLYDTTKKAILRTKIKKN